MAKRSKDTDGALAVVLMMAVIAVGSLIASALQSWGGRLALLAVFGGGGWLALRGFRWLRQVRRIRAETLGELLALTPQQFEHAVAQLLRDEGYRRVTVDGGAGDLQADITALAPDGGRVIVQCKRYAPGRNVGSPAVQSFIGMSAVHHKADHGLVVTTSSFTAPAEQLAKRHGIELIDGDALVRRIGQQRQRAGQPAGRATSPSPTSLPSAWPPAGRPPPPPPASGARPPSPPATDGGAWTARGPGAR